MMNCIMYHFNEKISNHSDSKSTFWFFSFPASNFKCNLVFFNFEFAIRKQNNKSVTFESVTRNEFFHFSTLKCKFLFLVFKLVTLSETFYFSISSKQLESRKIKNKPSSC